MADDYNKPSAGNLGRSIKWAFAGGFLLIIGGFVGHALGQNNLASGLRVASVLSSKLASEKKRNNASEAASKAKLHKLESDLATKARQLAVLSYEKCVESNFLAHQRTLMAKHIKANKNRLPNAIKRNGVSAAAGWIPFVGDFVDVGATAYDVREYKKMQREFDELQKQSNSGLSRAKKLCATKLKLSRRT